MNVAAISSVTSTFVSHPVARLQGIGASGAASASAAAAQTAAAGKTANFGPAVQVQLSPAAQALLAQPALATQANVAANNTANNNVGAQASAPSQASLALTYQSTAERVWVQVLGSLGLTQQELDALPLSQRTADETKAINLTEIYMNQQVSTPEGVSESDAQNSISAAVQAIAL